MPALTMRKSSDDWFVIEKAEHDGRIWMERNVEVGCMQLMSSARISDADVEGGKEDMLEIAEAIEKRSDAECRRCAVEVNGDKVEFWSPRNSMRRGVVTLAEADALAKDIRAKFTEWEVSVVEPKALPEGASESNSEEPKR